ncbi:MAG: hypothetical protein K2X93_18755 [Candidatus Obscuribacterales bacterium]|nr:hypothetical protein [Candidatus Obscuribacterales bacterium]
MISLTVNKVPTLFIKAFTAGDVEAILEFVRDAHAMKSEDGRSVLFIDTPITMHTIEAVVKLKEEGYRVFFRDHHGIDGEPANHRDMQVQSGTAKLEELLGADCLITVRRLHPACSTLVSPGEFSNAVAIIADPDADGLTAAMKASGIFYPELDDDAALLDGEPYFQVNGSPISQLLAKGVATLPSFDIKNPLLREKATQKLFSDWMEAVEGNARAKERLMKGVAAYDVAVEVARELATTAREVLPGVVLVDCADQPVYDVGTLNSLLEQRPSCRISVLRKSLGPIAALHGIQYSLTVVRSHQSEINLQKLLPPDTRSDPQYGVISNVSFLLHVSEYIWNEQVLPRLKAAI